MSRQSIMKSARAANLLGLDFRDEESERWLPVRGFPGYDVSDWGRVRSYWVRGCRPRIGDNPSILQGSVAVSRSGVPYIKVHLKQDDEFITFFVHVLVLEAFVSPRPVGMHGCHNDGYGANNRLDNLRWDTPTENHYDRFRNGEDRVARLARASIPIIWARLVAGESASAIARDYGVTQTAISCVKTGRTWSHTTSFLPGCPQVVRPGPGALPIYPAAEFRESLVEIWRPVPDREAYYISTFGRVMSSWVRGSAVEEVRTDGTWKELTISIGSGGYRYITTCDRDGKQRRLSIHSAVLEAFAGSRPSGMIACHSDGDAANNHANNLRWDTRRANVMDKQRHVREQAAQLTG
jgi:HNH endonuclease